MTGLAEYISREFGIECIPGRKHLCPKCGHKTFSMKHDGTVAKCFHPSCGWSVTPGHGERKPSLNKFLTELLLEWHKALLTPGDIRRKSAHEYLTEKRGISEKIIIGSSIGLVPHNADVSKILRPFLNELRNQEQKKGPGRPKKGGFDPQKYANQLEEYGHGLQKTVSKATGWLAFFFMDGRGRYCAIHFRKPYTKNFMTFKPKGMGLFGQDIFIPNEAKANLNLNDFGIVVEGEFDCLKIQSIIVEAGKAPAFVVATGGTTLVDMKALRLVIPKPVIIQDRDSAGDGMVDKISSVINCEVCSAPSPHKDIDEYLSSFKNDHKRALKALTSIIQSRKPKYKPLDAVKDHINIIRRGYLPDASEGAIPMKPHEINQKTAEVVIEEMKSRGTFFKDDQLTFYLSHETNEVMEIERENSILRAFLSQCGLNLTESIYHYVIEDIREEALRTGKPAKINRFSLLKLSDGEPSVLYLSAENNQMMRLTAESQEYVQNGTDEIMFLTSNECVPADISIDESSSGSLLDSVILEKIPFNTDRLISEEARFLMKCWILLLMMREMVPHRPILAMIGPMASGKSTSLQMIGQMLFGPDWDVVSVGQKEQDFDCQITNEILVALDNVDQKVGWLNDKLAVTATGGKIAIRKLYSNNVMIEYPIVASLALTSRTPYFRRNDVADRLLIIEVDSLHDREDLAFRSNRDFLEDVRSHRKELWAELLGICRSVLGVIDSVDLSSILVPGARMQDFARFTVLVGRALDCEILACGVWEKMKDAQREFAKGQDPFFEVMHLWVNESPGVEMASNEIAKELSRIAEQENIEWQYGGGRSIGQKIKNMWVELRESFTIVERKGVTNQSIYRFSPKESHESGPNPDDSGGDSGT